MAKASSLIKLSGTIAELTFVNSNAYGYHSRAKRGTYTEIALSAGMKASSIAQSLCNQRAKLIFDGVKILAPGFKNGRLWNRLVAAFRAQLKANGEHNFKSLAGFEIRPDYPTTKHGVFKLTKNNDDGNSSLHFNIPLRQRNSYRLTILQIIDTPDYSTADSKLILEVDLSELVGSLNFDFPKIDEDQQVVYLLKCEKLVEGKPSGLLKDLGVVVL